jgi:hypothetical protein
MVNWNGIFVSSAACQSIPMSRLRFPCDKPDLESRMLHYGASSDSPRLFPQILHVHRNMHQDVHHVT